MNNTNDQGLLQEIEEDLARQRMEKLWKKYGVYVAGAALFVVAVTAGVSAYKSYKISAAQSVTAAYIEVLKSAPDNKDELLAALEKFGAENKGKTQAVFAQLEAASEALDAGKKEKALELYNAVSADTSVETVFRQLADLLYVQTELDTGEGAVLEPRLQSLMQPTCVWRYTAQEYAGYLALRLGNKDKAKTLFTELKGMAGAPQSITARSTDVLTWLNEGK